MRKCNGSKDKIMRKLVIIGIGLEQFMVDWKWKATCTRQVLAYYNSLVESKLKWCK